MGIIQLSPNPYRRLERRAKEIKRSPDQLVEEWLQEALPYLSLAHVYDAFSYYHDNLDEIDRELAENTEEHWRAYLRTELGEERYRKITGRR